MIVTSVVLKLPRFLSFKLITIDAINVTEYWTTSMMEDPDYIRFSSYWDDLFVTGFLPLCISIFFNLRIYLKVRSYIFVYFHMSVKNVKEQKRIILEVYFHTL